MNAPVERPPERLASSAGTARRFPALLVPAGCTWIAAAVCCAVPGSASAILVAGFVLAGGCLCAVGAFRSRSRLVALLLLVAGCAAAAGVSGAAVHARADDRRPSALLQLGAQTVELDVVVTADGVPTGRADSASSTRFAADVIAVSALDGRLRAGLSVPALVFGSTEDDRVPRIGEHWRVNGSMRWNAPGDGRAVLVFARGPVVPLADAPELVAWSTTLRTGLVDIVAALPGPGGELLPGLAIGDTSRLGDEVEEAMQGSSLSHLTAVSGANCAIIVWLVIATAARFGAGLVLRVVLALVALGAFVVLVTPQPSVQRAALMAALVLVLGGFGRPARGLAALALAVIILLVIDPWLAVQYGFGLSVLATAGLLLLSGPLTVLLGRWVPRPLAVVIAVPTAAQIACQPMLVLLDPAIQLAGVPANLLAGPAAAPATLLGLLACLIAPISTPVAVAVAWLGWIPATWIGAVAKWFAGLSGARVPWPEGAIGVLLLAVPTAAIVLLLVFRERLPRRIVRTLGVGLLVCATLFVGRSVGGGLGTTLHRPSEWVVTACDVGQGDAVLVRAGGQTALVDVGPEAAPLRTCLDDLRVDRLSLLVLTHYDLDHVGGLAAVVGRVDEVLLGPVDDPEDARIARVLEEGGARVRSASAGDDGMLGRGEGAAGWRVLWPDPAAGTIEPGNDASVVVRFDTPTTSLMFLGDLGEQAQDRLLSRHALGGSADIVKMSHHGSADQSARLAQRLAARVALVSVGAANGYGHPTASAVELYEANGATTLRTDELGTVVVSVTDDGRFHTWSQRARPEARATSPGAGRLGRSRGAAVAAPRSAGRGKAKAPAKAAAAIPQLGWSEIRPAPIVLVSGTESFLADRAIRRLRDFLASEDPSLEVNDVAADSYAPGELITVASPSLFGEPRLVRVSQVEKCSDQFLTEALRYLESPAEGAYVVLRHNGGVRGKKLLDAIRSGAGGGVEIICTELKRDSDKADFAAAEFKAAGRRITPQALRALVGAFSDDLAELAAACSQLMADASEEITEQTVDKYYGGRVETSAFDVADAAIAGRHGEALLALRQALDSGADPVPIVAAFAMKIRTMAKVGSARGASGQIASQFGLAPWQVDRARRDLSGWTDAGIGRVVQMLAETDAGVKGATRDPVFALERLVGVVAARGVDPAAR